MDAEGPNSSHHEVCSPRLLPVPTAPLTSPLSCSPPCMCLLTFSFENRDALITGRAEMAPVPKHVAAMYLRDGNLQRRLGKLRQAVHSSESPDKVCHSQSAVFCFLFTDRKTISLSLSISAAAVIIRAHFQSHYPCFPFTGSVLQP